jgi:hypothetical protein
MSHVDDTFFDDVLRGSWQTSVLTCDAAGEDIWFDDAAHDTLRGDARPVGDTAIGSAALTLDRELIRRPARRSARAAEPRRGAHREQRMRCVAGALVTLLLLTLATLISGRVGFKHSAAGANVSTSKSPRSSHDVHAHEQARGAARPRAAVSAPGARAHRSAAARARPPRRRSARARPATTSTPSLPATVSRPARAPVALTPVARYSTPPSAGSFTPGDLPPVSHAPRAARPGRGQRPTRPHDAPFTPGDLPPASDAP